MQLIMGLLISTILMGLPSTAQLRTSGDLSAAFERGVIPSVLEPYIRAMGLRGFLKGRERIQLDGQFADPSGSTPARVTIELPGRTRLDGMRSDGVPILFDGDTARTTSTGLSDRDQVLLETFAVDSIEGLLGLASQGSDVRLFGRGFGPDPATLRPGEEAPRFDILEVTGPIPGRPGNVIQSRRYYFDTETRLLASVRHTEGGRKIETRYSNWGQLEDSAWPGLIERYEAGTLVFAFTTQAAGVSEAADISTFRLP